MRRILPLVLVLAVFWPSIAFARAEFQCLIDGKTRTHCCCPKPAKDAPPATSVRASSCCNVTPARPATVAAADTRAAREQMAVTATALVPPPPIIVPAPGPVAGPAIVNHALAPPDAGPALFARHCALLL